jgi:hypothetical protein
MEGEPKEIINQPKEIRILQKDMEGELKEIANQPKEIIVNTTREYRGRRTKGGDSIKPKKSRSLPKEMEGERKEIVNQPKEIGSQQKERMEGEPKDIVNLPKEIGGSPNILFNIIYLVKEPSLNTEQFTKFYPKLQLTREFLTYTNKIIIWFSLICLNFSLFLRACFNFSL